MQYLQLNIFLYPAFAYASFIQYFFPHQLYAQKSCSHLGHMLNLNDTLQEWLLNILNLFWDEFANKFYFR